MCRFVESSISYAKTIMKISLQGNKVFGFRAPKNFNSYFTFFGFKLNSFWHRFDSMLNRIHDAILPLMLKGSSRDAIASYFMVTISDIFFMIFSFHFMYVTEIIHYSSIFHLHTTNFFMIFFAQQWEKKK